MNKRTTIIKVMHGSNLFGTATQNSDLDMKSVFIPAASEILLGQVGSTNHEGTSNRHRKNTASDTDQDNHDVAKFVRMLQNGSPECFEILFAPESAYLHAPQDAWNIIIEKRDQLLHAQTSAFESLIRKTSSVVQLGEPEWIAVGKLLERINHKIDGGRKREPVERHIDSLIKAAGNVGVVDSVSRMGTDGVVHDYLRVANKYIPVGENLVFAQKLAFGMIKEIEANRVNGGLSPVLWKHLSHSVRLSYQLLELLETRRITFPRPEKELLLEIKLGIHTQEHVREVLDRLSQQLETAKQATCLTRQPDEAVFDDLIVGIHLLQVKNSFNLITKRECEPSNSLSLS